MAVSEKIYILLPVHNRCEITRRFVTCLRVQTYRNFHLVLIDDGSTDGTTEMVRESVESLTIIRGSGKWWWAGALHQGYQWLQHQEVSETDLVLMINDDTEFEPDFLQNAVSLLSGRQRAMLQAWCYCREDGGLIDPGVHVDWRKLSFEKAQSPREINCLSTNGLFVSVGDFLATGGFRPRLLPHYASDYEFTIRAHRHGMQLITDRSCHLRLDQSTTGYHQLLAEPLLASVVRLFSMKSTRNPIMWTIFLTLSCPFRYLFFNLLRIWRNFFVDLYLLIRLRYLDKTEGTS